MKAKQAWKQLKGITMDKVDFDALSDYETADTIRKVANDVEGFKQLVFELGVCEMMKYRRHKQKTPENTPGTPAAGSIPEPQEPALNAADLPEMPEHTEIQQGFPDDPDYTQLAELEKQLAEYPPDDKKRIAGLLDHMDYVLGRIIAGDGMEPQEKQYLKEKRKKYRNMRRDVRESLTQASCRRLEDLERQLKSCRPDKQDLEIRILKEINDIIREILYDSDDTDYIRKRGMWQKYSSYGERLYRLEHAAAEGKFSHQKQQS